MKRINFKKISVIDVGFIAWGMMGFICFFMFAHYDILVTAQQACTYLFPAVGDFYSVNAQITGSYGANYFPSTYVLFAIWNLPLKILGLTPEYWGDWNAAFTIWNKCFVVLVFCLCIKIFSKIVHQIKFSKEKSKIALLLFISTPACFFTVFISGQYDALTLLFILLGYYYWLYHDFYSQIKFILFFGFAATFKMFALLVFGVLLLLKEKKIEKIIFKVLLVCAPMLIVSLPYLIYDKEAFINQVFGFQVLDYVKIGSIYFGQANLQIFPFFICLILAFCFFDTSYSKRQLIEKSLFYSCGVFAAMFGFFNWYPQWMLLAVPFLVISSLMNKRYKTFLWLDMLLGVLYMLMVVNIYRGYLDENMMRNGIMRSLFYAKDYSSYSMADLFMYKNTDLIYTLTSVIFCVFFLFKSSKYCIKEEDSDNCEKNYMVLLRFLIPVMMFVVGAFSFIPGICARDERIWVQDEEVVEWLDADNLFQQVSLPCTHLSNIKVYTSINDNVDSIKLILYDDNGYEIAFSSIDSGNIANEGYSEFAFDGVSLDSGKKYGIAFQVKGSGKVMCGISRKANYHVKFYDVVNQDYEMDKLEYSGNEVDKALLTMKVLGRR